MKALIVGFGSIGKRHYEVLNGLHHISTIDIVTKQNIKGVTTYFALEDIEDLSQYNYMIVASETIKHFKQLAYICSKVQDKKILVEKPLYDKVYEKIETNNQIFIAYNLRFHPVLTKLTELLHNEDVYYANIICGQYLPTWRPEQDYRDSYSADINKGGGVLRDLSHELDYITWLFGDIKKLDTINTKISDLEIKSDDIFIGIGVTEHNTVINLSMDYISKTPIRRLTIHTKEHTIEADMIKNIISLTSKNTDNQRIVCESIDRNYTYSKMHEAIISGTYENICSFDEGIKIVNLIETIEYNEL